MLNLKDFRKYYKKHMSEVYGYVYMRTGQNREIAEDLVSEIFLKAIENFEQFSEEKGSFKSWIFQITKNHLTDYFRSNKNKPTQPIDILENTAASDANTQETASRFMESEEIKGAINDLPEKKRELILLRYFSNYSYKEIAEIYKEKPVNIRVKLHRILQELKNQLHKLT